MHLRLSNPSKYRLVHLKIERKYGKANTCYNETCKGKSKRFDWDNISGEYNLDIKDWTQLCRSCHSKKHVNKNRTHCVNGHELTKDNTYLTPKNNSRLCNICRRTHRKKYLNKRDTE